jgi:hypothetical protein
MKPRDIFHLAIRLLGLVFVYLSFKAVPVIFLDGGRSLLFVACYFVAALWLIGGAQFLMDRAYPDDEAEVHRPIPPQEPPTRNPMPGSPP